MKRISRSLLAPVLAFSLPAFILHAQAPAGGDPFVKDSTGASPAADAGKAAQTQNCLLVLEVYALDKNEALSVLESERGSTARYRRVIDIAKAGKARLEVLTALNSKSGQRADNDSYDEVRYPTEFTLPRSKNDVAAPAAFESRNVGDTFDLEPDIALDGRTCRVNLAPKRVCLAGFRDVGGMAEDAIISQPLFTSQNLTATTSLTDGEPHYLGTFTPPAPQGIANGPASEVWLAFLHLSVQRVASVQDKAPTKPTEWSAIDLEYTCFSLERNLAREILIAPATIDAPWEKLEALLAQKKARFEHLTTVTTRSGQRAVVGGFEELRYASEYTPAEQLSSSENTTHTTTADKSTTTENINVTRTEPNAGLKPGGPSAFETRSSGISVEVEPVVNKEGTVIDVNEVVQSVSNLGNLKVTGIATRYPAQPLFESRRIATGQLLPPGRHILVGTLNLPGADGVNDRVDSGRTWLVFVRATPNEQ